MDRGQARFQKFCGKFLYRIRSIHTSYNDNYVSLLMNFGGRLDTSHNPDRFIADLRQILSQGRKRIGLLIGAGAPLSIKVNAANELDDEGIPLIQGVEQLTTTVLGALTGVQATVAQSMRKELGENANIESILSRVRLLQQALGPSDFKGLNSDGYATLGKSICANIGAAVGVNLPKQHNAYTELVTWISGTLRTNAVEVFTTNYDLLLEEAFERARSPYFDGFTGGNEPFFDPVTVFGDDLPARWSRLWKLHGSVGWELCNGAVIRKGGRNATNLVYPDHLKYDLTQKQPYASLFERLKEFLLTPDTLLLAIGFSFRDSHVCTVLDEALAMNANTAVIAFQYQDLSRERPVCSLAMARPNISVYATDGAVISGVEGKWKLGELPKNWIDIRSSFWGSIVATGEEGFLLGDFCRFTHFCALAHARDYGRVVGSVTHRPIIAPVLEDPCQ